MRLIMTPISITVKCFKKRSEGSLQLYFESNTTLNSGLFLYDVFTLTIEQYKDVLSSSPSTFVLEVRVESDKDYILGHTIIPSCI